jgi:hypothetical protein
MGLEEGAKALLYDYLLLLCRLQALYKLRSKAARHHRPRLGAHIHTAAGVLYIIPYSFEAPICPFQHSSIV